MESFLNKIHYLLLNGFFIAFLPFLILGLINKVKAFWAGRKGPPLMQPLYDFLRLLKKRKIYSNKTSLVFYLNSSIAIVTSLLAAILTPMLGKIAFIAFPGDFILWLYLIALGKFFNIAAAMDTASSFEGMGASREANLHPFVEVGVSIAFATLAFTTSSLSMSHMLQSIHIYSTHTLIIYFLVALALGFILLFEGYRIPIDDPNTHLELTMIHEVMILDNSGSDLALVQYSTALKMLSISAIIANIFIPNDLSITLQGFLFLAIICTIAIIIGTIESLSARLRLIYLPQFALFATSTGLVAFIIALFLKN